MTNRAITARGRQLARARHSSRAMEGGGLSSVAGPPAGARAFAFGDPEPVLNRRDFLDCIEAWHNGRWYEPPIPLGALSRAANVSPHHASAMNIKVQMLVKDFIPHPWLNRHTFEGLAKDLEVLGNYYVERVDNLAGRPMALKRALARYTRRGLEDGVFWWLPANGREERFRDGTVLQYMKPGLDQEIYGLPEYLCALQSAMLNEAATIFRRLYYKNGTHSGYIFYISEEKLSEVDADAIEEALKKSKGPGNFSSLFLHVPGGKKDGIQLLHPGEAAAKDEFLGVKGVSRDDILAAHRVPPQLLGIIPQNSGGFGDVEKAANVFYENEIIPLQRRFEAINDWLGEEVVRFAPRERPSTSVE